MKSRPSIIYADDITFYYSDKQKDIVKSADEEIMNLFQSWFSINNRKLNVDKSIKILLTLKDLPMMKDHINLLGFTGSNS